MCSAALHSGSQIFSVNSYSHNLVLRPLCVDHSSLPFDLVVFSLAPYIPSVAQEAELFKIQHQYWLTTYFVSRRAFRLRYHHPYQTYHVRTRGCWFYPGRSPYSN